MMSGKMAHDFSLVIAFLFFQVLCASVELAAAEEPNSNAAMLSSIEELKADFDSLMAENSIPGGAFALVFRDSIRIEVSGVTDLETGEPVTEETHFRIGSCTKSFVGLGFLRLVEEGKIDLDTPVRSIAPEIDIDNPWEETEPVRVVHLLEHTAGFEDSRPNWFYFEGPVLSLRRALEIKSKLRTVRWPPGTRFSYSSPGYVFAGYVMEKVCGQPYEDYIEQTVLEPMGMKTSTIGRANEDSRLLATGYERDMTPVLGWFDYDEPAGAMNSSIREMALFIQCMLNRGMAGEVQVFGEESIARIGRPNTTMAAKSGLQDGYSFGISARFYDGWKWYGHGGAVPGFLAEYAYSTDLGYGYVLLFNRFAPLDYYEMFRLVRGYLTQGASIPPAIPAVSVPKSRLESYCGYYEPRNPRMRLMEFMEILVGGVTISYENDTLYEKSFMSGREPLIPVSQNMFRKTDDIRANRVFAESTEGREVYATKGSYYEKTAGWRPVAYQALFFGALIVMATAIVYAAFWIPVHLYKKIRSSRNRSRYLRMRIIPLAGILSLVVGTIIVADQTILGFGSVTMRNVLFFVSTLAFAILSLLSVYFSFRSFFKPVAMTARIYGVILSSACLGMTLYLSYWGIIGIRLWSY